MALVHPAHLKEEEVTGGEGGAVAEDWILLHKTLRSSKGYRHLSLILIQPNAWVLKSAPPPCSSNRSAFMHYTENVQNMLLKL